MDIIEAYETRGSKRAFLDKPVPKELLVKIMQTAMRVATTADTQAYELYIFGGETIKQIKKEHMERVLAEVPTNPDMPYRPSEWPEPYASRRKALEDPKYGKTTFDLLGIDYRSPDARMQFNKMGCGNLFGAPNGIVICLDKKLGIFEPWCLLDCGALMQAIMLIAHSYGLGSVPQMQIVAYPEVLRKVLNIPDTKKIIGGISWLSSDAPIKPTRAESRDEW
jgi:nitroreductase